MNNKFYENIKKFNMIKEGEEIIAAVSGGADSIFLLSNLLELKEEINFNIILAHVNHGIRETAKRDEDFVEELSKKFNLGYRVAHVNMNKYARENNLTEEEAGRVLRYEFFRSIKEDCKIFVAHNEDDQAETVLQRIIRGTGIEGLSSMEYVSKDIYRPMLNIKRAEIEKYLEEEKILYVNDESNFTLDYSRNKIRLELIPYVEKEFNDNFKESLIRLSDLARQNSEFIKNIVDKFLEKNYKENILCIKDLLVEDEYFISEVIRGFLKREIGNIYGFSKKNIEDIVSIIKLGENTSLTLPKGEQIEISYNKIYLKNKFKEKKTESKVLKIGYNHTGFGLFKVTEEKQVKKENAIIIDRDKIIGNLYLRNRKIGDRFTPMGMKGSKKLKDFFIDEKIDSIKRDSTPIICDDKEIIWVCPYRMSEKYKVDKDTKNILSIIWEV